MKLLKKSDINLIIAVIALLLSAAAISASIIYVKNSPVYYTEPAAFLNDPVRPAAPDKCFEESLPEPPSANDKMYSTPYGSFELIDSVVQINEYLTENPTVPDPSLCTVYITESGDKERAEEILKQIKKLADEICSGCTDDYSKAYALAMWTGQNIAYDFDAAETSVDLSVTSLEAIFENGMRTTCAGFSNFYSALCHSQGIYCLNLKGGSASEGWTRAELDKTPANHEWNAVAIDGQWYYADCTWISDLSYENGEISGGKEIKPFYALFGFGEMCVEHRIDRSEHICYSIK